MSNEAHQITVDKFFKFVAWVSYFTAGVLALSLILIVTGILSPNQVILPIFANLICTPLLLAGHSLWAK